MQNIVCGLLQAKASTDEHTDTADDVDRTFEHEALTDAVMMAILQDASALEERQQDARPALVTELADLA